LLFTDRETTPALQVRNDTKGTFEEVPFFISCKNGVGGCVFGFPAAETVVSDLIELVQHAVRERKPRLLTDEGFFTYHRYPLLKGGALMFIKNTERYAIPEFKRPPECLNAVLRRILHLEPVTSLSVPIVRIHPVKGNARLEDINQ
jgi:hypothetical protein